MKTKIKIIKNSKFEFHFLIMPPPFTIIRSPRSSNLMRWNFKISWLKSTNGEHQPRMLGASHTNVSVSLSDEWVWVFVLECVRPFTERVPISQFSTLACDIWTCVIIADYRVTRADFYLIVLHLSIWRETNWIFPLRYRQVSAILQNLRYLKIFSFFFFNFCWFCSRYK